MKMKTSCIRLGGHRRLELPLYALVSALKAHPQGVRRLSGCAIRKENDFDTMKEYRHHTIIIASYEGSANIETENLAFVGKK